ncbi:ATP-grasp domain-containing protein [Nonomuraea rhodomycinica]|uniref:ATP-grasp domain-containing protein n=1 Tax=Nonomuraea rhodomycinica TaxID=1712872 RepID=A0A7Y6IJ50_9ACTN|nr:ATP-grasp domain-containing protein [Nonomuraea rhodomycinica]NUW39103.1 ATP-grasp domain-containing protein [Nonomuraea rhodomycinica]
MRVGFLFCADPLRPRRVDPHFAAEADAARERGAPVALVDHDALVAGRAEEAVSRVPRGYGRYWYRGWMLTADRYERLQEALAERGGVLLTDATGYRRAHELPGWLGRFYHLTPPTGVVRMAPGESAPDGERLARLARGLSDDGFVVKDFVKSRKHEWLEACYATDPASLGRVARRFVELQGADLVGGLVIRGFERFTGPEVRVWWVDGAPVFTGPHPDHAGEPVERPTGLRAVREAVRDLGERFVTTDLARREDGVWRVVEVGDGQVSDWPVTADPGILIRALLRAKAYGFRLSKYDPALRDACGRFRGDDWTGMSDIGQVFDGVRLTRERYEEVENAYLRAVELLARDAGVARLRIRRPDTRRRRRLREGRSVPLGRALEIVRDMLRGKGWCVLENRDRFFVHAGYDYYLHVAGAAVSEETMAEIGRLGLFAEEEPAMLPVFDG